VVLIVYPSGGNAALSRSSSRYEYWFHLTHATHGRKDHATARAQMDLPRKHLGTLFGILIGLGLVLQPAGVLAGPPLISDDPNTVGPGVVQPILAVSVAHEGKTTLVRAPLVDLTVGLVDSLDMTFIASLDGLPIRAGEVWWRPNSLLAPGLKWELFETDRGSLALSPAFAVNMARISRSFALLPLQGELAVGARRRAVIGFDVGYEPVLNSVHRWFVAPYARYSVSRKLDVLFETWCLGSGASANLGGSLGTDYGILGSEIRLLAALSTAFVAFNAPRLEVRAYLGIQYTFATKRSSGSKQGMAESVAYPAEP